VDEDESYLPPDDEPDDEPMTEAEVPVSDEVPDDDDGGDGGDGEEASEEGDEPGLEETKHKKINELKNMETLKFQ
jgi:hypothetical protein